MEVSNDCKTFKDLCLFDKEKWQSLLNFRSRRLTGFRTGIRSLDSEILGLSGIVGIQGAPGSCKSTLALQIASFNASEGTPVLIIDRENGLNRFKVRLACQVGEVSQQHILTCPEGELRERMLQIAELPIFVDTSPDLQIEDVKLYLSQMWEHFQQPMLLVVDSLQALPRHGQEERIALEKWLGDLDQLKLDYEGKLVILMTSEKRRGAYNEASKDGGKGTGSIEFKAELLIDVRTEADSPLVIAQVVKNRDGACLSDLFFSRKSSDGDPRNFCFKLEEAHKEAL